MSLEIDLKDVYKATLDALLHEASKRNQLHIAVAALIESTTDAIAHLPGERRQRVYFTLGELMRAKAQAWRIDE